MSRVNRLARSSDPMGAGRASLARAPIGLCDAPSERKADTTASNISSFASHTHSPGRDEGANGVDEPALESAALAPNTTRRRGTVPLSGQLASPYALERHCARPSLISVMRIATWNVNSLKARLEKVTWW